MKKINKILGIVLTVAVLASLVLVATPASAAATLQWNKEGIPSQPGMLASGEDITDIAVAADGTTIYIATGGVVANDIFKSTNGGISWTPIPTAGANCDLVAVAPDNANLVVAVDAATGTTYVTTNGGARWSTLAVGPLAAVDLDVSAAGPTNYIAIADGTTVWYYDLGIGGAWQDMTAAPWPAAGAAGGITGTSTYAVKFSPNFASDQVLMAITDDATDTFFEVADMSGSFNWNVAPFTGYPVRIVAADTPTNASLAVAPTYLGSDEVERVAFASIYGFAGGASDGIYRIADVNVKGIKNGTAALPFQTHSIAYDGTTLVTGSNAGTTVWRSTDALATSPTFAPSAATKSPSGNIDPTALTTVAFAGTKVVAGSVGLESAFSVSTDGGKTFADISFIDCEIAPVATATGIIDDFAVAPDNSVVYLLSEDTTSGAISLWRYASNAWSRVLCALGTGYIVRIYPSNPNVVYVVEYAGAGKTIYYSKDGGVSKWYNRIGPGVGIADLAVESENVAYAATGANVQKTTNGAFTWGPPSAVTGMAAVYTLHVVSEGNLLAGGATGEVAYSTDGNASWVPIPAAVGGTGAVNLTASGLSTGDYIYATENSAGGIYRWQIGQEATAPWLQIDGGVATVADVGSGIVLQGGNLYCLGYDAATPDVEIVRSTMPGGEPTPPPMDNIPAGALDAAAVPSALRVNATSSYIKLWFADINNTGVLATHRMAIYSYQDTLALVSPTLSAPINGAQAPVNALNGAVYDMSFTWAAIPGVTGVGAYNIEFYLDEAGTQSVVGLIGVNYLGGPPVVATVQGPTTGVPFMPGTTYYWRVQAALPISSGWSEMRSFTVEATPAVVAKPGSPVNGATVTTKTPAFSWAPIGGTTKYQFQLTDDVSFASTIVDTTTIAAGYQATEDLVVGETYFWRVKALEPVEGEWSEVANFVVAEPAAATTAAPTINVPTITVPPITVPTPVVTVTPSGSTVSPALLWTVIIIGAILVIALIVLIVRTRRTV